MVHMLRAYGAVYNHPGKGHDRLFIDNAQKFFGVFDGAGGAELSDAIVRTLPEIMKRESTLRKVSHAVFMAAVIAEIDNLAEGSWRKSTGAIASIDAGQRDTEITFANAGDSRLYFYNKTKNSFKLIAHSPTRYVTINGQTYIDTQEFLGAKRTPDEIASLMGKLVVPRSHEWTLVGMSDGVQDDDGQGINSATLESIVRGTAPKYMPGVILDAVDKYDDASVFVASYETAV